jgi:hypothetical protein
MKYWEMVKFVVDIAVHNPPNIPMNEANMYNSGIINVKASTLAKTKKLCQKTQLSVMRQPLH